MDEQLTKFPVVRRPKQPIWLVQINFDQVESIFVLVFRVTLWQLKKDQETASSSSVRTTCFSRLWSTTNEHPRLGPSTSWKAEDWLTWTRLHCRTNLSIHSVDWVNHCRQKHISVCLSRALSPSKIFHFTWRFPIEISNSVDCRQWSTTLTCPSRLVSSKVSGVWRTWTS